VNARPSQALSHSGPFKHPRQAALPSDDAYGRCRARRRTRSGVARTGPRSTLLGVGDAQLRFAHSTVSLWSTIGVSPGGTALVRPYALDGVALLLPPLSDEVTALDISPGGRLPLTLGGATVWSGSDPDYEAWSYDGRQGEKVVCTPGGELAIWTADR
jgi:hypothetical protein